ncbi:uncharacterized protein LOC142172928 isoform X1 [Nicotiana tabacum]|uniref:Uncharacterized protein LOC142172928 isoform X1 n=1 Tax=Nicotiana tabacum TaxID=4097 RepID=A0AC58T7H4_TOBAC
MSTIQNEPFSIMTKIPFELRLWWNDLGKEGQDKVKKYLKDLPDLLNIQPRGDIIRSLVTCWDSAHNVFHFSDFELTPTLEEIAGYIGNDEATLRFKYLIAPRAVTIHRFLDSLKIPRTFHHPDFAKGFCSLRLIYARYGHVGGFNKPDFKLCSRDNRQKWDEHRLVAFMIAFLGLIVFPRKDGNIDLKVAGVVSTLLTQDKSTLAPMIMADIFRALTACRAGGNFFEGCNLLLQMWMIDHLCHRSQLLGYGSPEKTCIGEFYTRIKGVSLPEGVTAWTSFFRTLTANQIQWTLGWFPVEEILYMPATRPHFLLMGLKSIQSYAPYRVLRQLGRYQVVPKDEDLSTQVVEISPDGRFPEKEVRQIWSECQHLTANTCVLDTAKGEVSPGYHAWFRGDTSCERPAKRPHLIDFAESSQEQWNWLAKENGYRVEIGELKQQVESLKFNNSVQVAADRGERNRLTQENKELRAQIQKLRMAPDKQPRCRSDEQLIKGLKNEVREWRDGLEKFENIMAKLKAQWGTRADKRCRYLNQLKHDHEKALANMKRNVATLEGKTVKQAEDFQIESGHCYDLLA